jgi:hypothetical protein
VDDPTRPGKPRTNGTITDAELGVRRFCVRAPDGNLINVVSHSDE